MSRIEMTSIGLPPSVTGAYSRSLPSMSESAARSVVLRSTAVIFSGVCGLGSPFDHSAAT